MLQFRPDTGGFPTSWSYLLGATLILLLSISAEGPVVSVSGAAEPTRAYEMVTPAEKPTRRGGKPFPDHLSGEIALPARDGESVLSRLQWGLLSDAELAWPHDFAISRRSPTGWETHSIYTAEIHGGVNAGSLASVADISPDLSTLTLGTSTAMVTDENPLGKPPAALDVYPYTKFSDSRQFQLWLTDPSTRIGTDDRANFSDDSSTMIRSGEYRGLLGPEDPSLLQVAGANGGRSVYAMDIATGSRFLLSECTGESPNATLVPERLPSGKLGAQPCDAGSPLSVRGTTAGARDSAYGATAAASLYGSREMSVAADGRTVALTAPEVGNQPPAATQGCTTATGADTLCQPQVYVSRFLPSGERVVRWISQPEVENQDASLLGKGAAFEAMSRSGNRILFRTNAPLTTDDPNGTGTPSPGGIKTGNASPNSWDLYIYDLPADPEADPGDGELTRVTAGPTGNADPNTNCAGTTGSGAAQTCNANAGGGVVRFMSDDGERIYFVTTSEIPGAINAPPTGSSATNLPQSGPNNPYANTTSRNLYLWDEKRPPASRWRFIASLPVTTSTSANLASCAALYAGYDSPFSLGSGTTGDPTIGMAKKNCVRGTPDGRHLLLFTDAQVTADDEDSAFDLIEYDLESDSLQRVTTPPDGGEPYVCVTSGPLYCNGSVGWSPPASSEHMRYTNLTDDGAVIFETRLRMLPDQDQNGDRMDVYLWRDGELTLITPGDSEDDAYYSGNTQDGSSIFFMTTQPIDKWREIDPGDQDLYVARVGGGFPPPKIEEPCDFGASGCHRAPSEAPGFLSSSTSSQRSGNPASPAARAQCRRSRSQLRKNRRRLAKARKAAGRRPANRRLRAKVRRQKKVVMQQRAAVKRCQKSKGEAR